MVDIILSILTRATTSNDVAARPLPQAGEVKIAPLSSLFPFTGEG
jgi:hypothetical protein